MPRYFAEIVNEVVERVIVADSLEWCVNNLGGEWKETFMDNPDKNYAGKGHTHDSLSDNFIAPKPYESWVLDEKQKWTSPVKKPEGDFSWNDSAQKWESFDKVINKLK